MSVMPLTKIIREKNSSDFAAQLQEIAYIIEHADPTESVLDGFTGTGVFRPGAHFFGVLPSNVRQTLTKWEKERILDDLRSGIIVPKIVILDNDLKDLSPEITAFTRDQYYPVGIGNLWQRKEMTSMVRVD
jgi:hypothetical protein